MRFNTTSFINEIKQRPALWDTKNSTPDDRHQAWEEIFSIYTDVENIGYEDQSELNSILQRRWKNLRDSYVKFCKRMQTNNDGVAKYIFAKRLNFLDKVISPNSVSRKRLLEKKNEGEKEDEEEKAVQNTHKKRKIKIRPDKEDDDDDNGNGIQGPEEINLDEICNGESTFDYNILDNNSMEESSFVQSSNSQYEDRKYYFDPEPHGKDSQAPERDECTVYGELVGVKLRKLNPRTRVYVQHLINNTLFEAEMGKYNKPTAIFFPSSDENN